MVVLPRQVGQTIAAALRSVGYVSASIGKWHLGDDSEHHPSQRGFDEAIVSMTLFARVLDAVDPHWLYDLNRRRVLFAFDALPDQLLQPGPSIVFAHVVAPHPPFHLERVDDCRSQGPIVLLRHDAHVHAEQIEDFAFEPEEKSSDGSSVTDGSTLCGMHCL